MTRQAAHVGDQRLSGVERDHVAEHHDQRAPLVFDAEISQGAAIIGFDRLRLEVVQQLQHRVELPAAFAGR